MICKVGCLLRGPNGRPLQAIHYAIVEAASGDDAVAKAREVVEGIVAVVSVYPATADDIAPPVAGLEGQEDLTEDGPDAETAAIKALETPEALADAIPVDDPHYGAGANLPAAAEPAKGGKKGGKK